MKEWVWSIGGMILNRENGSTQGKTQYSVTFLPQIPYRLDWDWTSISMMNNQWYLAIFIVFVCYKKHKLLTYWISLRIVICINNIRAYEPPEKERAQ